MANPKISVIVPIYKVEKYLVQCIDSILNQTLRDIEIILVDEGDLDACRAICDMYEFGVKKDPRIKTIHEKNGGYGASCNKGMDIATGEYISIIESDDFIEPTMYEEMYAYAKKLNADVVKTPYYEFRDATKNTHSTKTICPYAQAMRESTPKDHLFSAQDYPLIMGVHASLWSGIYKTTYLREKNIRFITAKGGAYVDVGFRIDTLINTDKIAWYDKPFYNYRLSNENSTTNQFNLTAMLKRWEEAHQTFKDRMDLYEKVGPESVVDEYVNTAGYLRTDYPVTPEHINMMYKLYQNIPDSVITKSKLGDMDKDVMLRIKRGDKGPFFKKQRSWYYTFIRVKLNQATFHFFKYLKYNLFRIQFRIDKLWALDICVGAVK